MILFFDTETTGKADFRSSPDAEHQPRLVQLAGLLQDDGGNEMASINAIIKPNGFKIPESASSIHGVTDDLAFNYGVDLELALSLFAQLATKPKVIAAHNIEFDLFVLTGEYMRLEYSEIPMDGAVQFCTMQSMTDICCIPGPYGNKWPKLQEAYKHAFNCEFEGAHDAMADVRACAKLYWWLKSKEAK